MDFVHLDRLINRIASQHGWTEEQVLEEWSERRRQADDDPDHWKEAEGIPCVIGGLTALCGNLNGRGGSFPWRTLPTILAQRGLILHNYPHNVIFPGEKRATLARSKGIHDLTLSDQATLADALRLGLLTIQHTTNLKTRRRLLTSREPVILGEAPPPESPHTHGRRAFVDGRIDRKGLPRQQPSPEPSPAPSRSFRPRRGVLRVISPDPSPEVSPAPPTASRQSRSFRPRRLVLRVSSPHPSPEVSPAPPTASRQSWPFRPRRLFVEVPLAPPSWKVKAMQRRSSSAMATPSTSGERCSPSAVATPSAPARVNTPPSAQRTDPGELIPLIACMSQPLSSQRSAITDVAIDENLEDAVDGLVASQ